jgi:hypothetical protein
VTGGESFHYLIFVLFGLVWFFSKRNESCTIVNTNLTNSNQSNKTEEKKEEEETEEENEQRKATTT